MAEPTSGARPTWSVGELSAAITAHLRAGFPSEVWVRGEIQNFPKAAGHHSYFTLVDSESDPPAQLSVVLLNSEKQRVNRLLMKAGYRVRMTDGTEVRIRGRIDWYAPRGQLQLRMTSIDPAFTLGQLAAARADLLDRLQREGLLDANRRVPMPLVPLRVGVVTSAGSAAEADLLDELDRSGYAFEVRVADVRVQGADAATSIAGAITWFAGRAVDVVVVVRGGGAATDLAAFDHELVARAVAASPHPVITGIGHEVDRSVADEVAHLAAKTPTAAAQHLVALVATAHVRAEEAYAAVVRRAEHLARAAAQRLDRMEARAAAAAVAATRAELARIDACAARVAPLAHRQLERVSSAVDTGARRLRTAGPRRIDEAAQRLDLLATRVSLLDPTRALARGWSITRGADGAVLRSVADLAAGTTVHTTLADGTVTSVVDGVERT